MKPRSLCRFGVHGQVFQALAVAMALALPALAQDQPAGTDGCRSAYVIGPEDVLDIAVWNSAELTRTVPVRPDGKLSLPLLDDVQAAGLTPMELRSRLTKALTQFISKPAVSVLVREIHSFKVSVIGQVKTPGRYELRGRATVLDVLAMAGGFTDFAARGRITIIRQDGATTRQIPFSYNKLTESGSARTGVKNSNEGHENFCVQPGDVVVVP